MKFPAEAETEENTMKRLCALLLAALLAAGITGCGTMDPDEATESIQVIAMDTAMIFTAYGANSTKATYAAEAEAYRLEALLSRTEEESPVAQLNSQGTAQVDAELWALIETALDYTAATDGAFDITVAPVLLAWGFTTDEYQVPSQAELDTLLPLVGPEHIRSLGENGDGTVTVELDPGTQIDLGAIGKGYASDRVAAIFREYDPDRSPASWALKWVASHSNVKVTLSGMSSMEQMVDNIRLLNIRREERHLRPLLLAGVKQHYRFVYLRAVIDAAPRKDYRNFFHIPIFFILTRAGQFYFSSNFKYETVVCYMHALREFFLPDLVVYMASSVREIGDLRADSGGVVYCLVNRHVRGVFFQF